MGVAAIYAGTFDPITLGHSNIVERACKMYDRVVIAVAKSTLKNTMFDLPGQDEVQEVVVNEEAVSAEAAPLMIYSDTKKEPASAG